MDTNEEWSVPNSDDERDDALLGLTQNGRHHLPVKILRYYEDIERNKVLELNVKEFRKPFEQGNTDVDKERCQEDLQEERKEDEAIPTCTEEKEQLSCLEKSNEPSAFDYLEEPDDCQEQVTRRTPKTGRLPKKRVGTLKNVISNLKRYKQLDSSTDEESKLTTAEIKSDFESNKDVSELKDSPVDSENT